mmetsp:Transcript_32995/g.53949  ORF Transcript_32995/g.53949 Transcript_32995/m.53949 type:complete len:83 (+) Transcript_32995:598-846(+)
MFGCARRGGFPDAVEVEGRQGYSVQHSHKQHQAQFVSYDGKQRLSKSQRYFPKRQSVGVPINFAGKPENHQQDHVNRSADWA